MRLRHFGEASFVWDLPHTFVIVFFGTFLPASTQIYFYEEFAYPNKDEVENR